MNSPIVHIGYHKTATSWFQKSLYPYVRNTTYLNRNLVRDIFLNTTAFAFNAEAAEKKLAVAKRPVICEEDLCGHYDNGGLLEALSKDIAYRIHSVYPDAQIVIFIRNQLDMILSTYLQYVRGGGTRSLTRFLVPYARGSLYRRRWYKKPMLTLDHFAYQNLIRHYRTVFGSANIHVFCYEDFAADPRSFAKDYATRFELDAPLDQLSYARRNESLGMISLQLARLLGPFSRWDTPNRLVLLPVMPMWMHKAGLEAFNKTTLSGSRTTPENLFGEKLYHSLYERFAADNRALSRMLELPLEQHAYPLPAREG